MCLLLVIIGLWMDVCFVYFLLSPHFVDFVFEEFEFVCTANAKNY